MTRIFSIIQLCFAFTLVCWVCSYPFLGEMMAHKKQLFLFQNAMGTGDLIMRTYSHDQEAMAKLERNRARFESLEPVQKELIIRSYHQILKTEEQRTFFTKFQESFSLLLFKLPTFDRAWIFFAITLSILLLLQTSGSAYAVWLLPLIVIAGAIDNQIYGLKPSAEAEARLFPSEEYLAKTYLETSSPPDMAQLKKAWELYLVAEVLCEAPSANDKLQVEEGEWLFQLKRLLITKPQPFFQRKEPLALWGLYLGWNILFAWGTTRRTRELPVQVLSRM